MDYNSGEFGFSGDDLRIDLLAAERTGNPFWQNLANANGFSLHTVTLGERDDTGQSDSAQGAGFREIENRTVLSGWLTDQADLLLLLWNEKQDAEGSFACELLQTGRQKKIPCIWISTLQENKVYWSEDSYFEEYSAERLKRFCGTLLGGAGESRPASPEKMPLLSLGRRLYDRFMQKYRALLKPMPYVVDEMLGEDFAFLQEDTQAELTRRNLVESFNRFDRAAIAMAQKYRAIIYLRSVLPFLATILLAVGFYSETVMGFFLKVTIGGISVWSLLAGTGFLIHALINLYVFYLSGHKTVHNWHRGFINDRFIAETLRILIHFMPFGIPVNVRSVMNRCSSRLSRNESLYAQIHKIMRGSAFIPARTDRASVKRLLENVLLLIDDQIIYHKNTAARYRTIINRLKKYALIFFQIGFIFVLLRGVLQFCLVYITVGSSSNGITLMSFIRSFANMLALFLPAWASYFSTKLSLCNFSELLENDEEMITELEKMKRLVEDIVSREEIHFDILRSLAEELSVLLLSEVTGWYAQLSVKQVTRL